MSFITAPGQCSLRFTLFFFSKSPTTDLKLFSFRLIFGPSRCILGIEINMIIHIDTRQTTYNPTLLLSTHTHI